MCQYTFYYVIINIYFRKLKCLKLKFMLLRYPFIFFVTILFSFKCIPHKTITTPLVKTDGSLNIKKRALEIRKNVSLTIVHILELSLRVPDSFSLNPVGKHIQQEDNNSCFKSRCKKPREYKILKLQWNNC